MKESNVWYDQSKDPLKAEEIEGRIVVETYLGPSGEILVSSHHPHEKTFSPEGIVKSLNHSGFPAISYILIPLPEEQPLELDGVKPVVIDEVGFHRVSYTTSKDLYATGIHQFYGETVAEAIHNANEFIRRLK